MLRYNDCSFCIAGGHTCFDGTCRANCNGGSPVCADDDYLVEGSMSAVVPLQLAAFVNNPFFVQCIDCINKNDVIDDLKRRLARGSDFCSSKVRQLAPFDNDEGLLSLIDGQIFDFFTGRNIRLIDGQ
jgi:Golgi casein kinase, C-terminal, Fam20